MTTIEHKREDITNILLETTPLYKDLIGIVMEYYLEAEPTKFEVGKKYAWKPFLCKWFFAGDMTEYCQKYYDKVIKKTKRYITFQYITFRGETKTIKEKIKYDKKNNNTEYTESINSCDVIV